MALTVKHNKVATIPDDPSVEIGKDEWNEDHPVTGILEPSKGGSGVSNNDASTITISGAHPVTLTVGATTNVTLPASGTLISLADVTGKQGIPIPASAMSPNTTNGPTLNSLELTTNDQQIETLDFSPTTSQSAQFGFRMPKSVPAAATITFVPLWSHASTTTNFGVVWELKAVAYGDSDAMDVAFGTGQTSTDTGGTTNDMWIGPESAAITIAGPLAQGDWVQCRIARLTANGSDTMAIDARLHGIELFVTTDKANDA